MPFKTPHIEGGQMGRKKTTATDAAATKLRIIETAESLFRDIGYAKTTVSDIAKSLGMSQANVYRYFKTKSSINEAICDRIVHHIESQCLESLIQDGTSTERLSRFILEYHRVVKTSIIKEKKLYDMVSVAMDEHWAVIQSHSDRIVDLLRIIIDQGVASGEFRSLDSPKMAIVVHEALAHFIYPSLLEHWINDKSINDNQNDTEEELRQLLDLILYGLASGHK
jgi:AcrR family transcriptional regulator